MDLEGGHKFTKYAAEWLAKRADNKNFEGDDIYSFSTSVDVSVVGGNYFTISTLLVNKENQQPFNMEEIASAMKGISDVKEFKVTNLGDVAIRDDLVFFINSSINKTKQSNSIYTELMPIGISPIQTKYVLQPIQLISEVDEEKIVTYIDIVMYCYIDGRCILRFSYDFDENDIHKDFSIFKQIKFARVPHFIVNQETEKGEKLKIKDHAQLDVDTGEKVMVKYINFIISQIGVLPTINENYEHISLMNVNDEKVKIGKESKAFLKIAYGLSHSPMSIKRLSDIGNNTIAEYFNNILDVSGVMMGKYKLVAWSSDSYKEAIWSFEDNPNTPEEYFFVHMNEELWPMLESVLLKSLRQKVALFSFENKLLSEKDMQSSLKSAYLESRSENAILYSGRASVEELTDLFEERIIPTHRKRRMDELMVQHNEIQNFTHSRIKNQTSFLLTFIGIILTIVLSYDVIEKLVIAYAISMSVTIAYIIFIGAFLFLIAAILFYQKRSKL
ncbi:hypothetical protein [Listeria seeligeri]|uniref:hypothetical protein n=1 Tax=Listeria seeligeri TaxID=1640 RepID=UPI00311AC3BA